MPKTRLQKEEGVLKLKEKLGRATALVFADYKGLSMKQLSDIRNKLRDQQAEFTITKNTLLDFALKNSQLSIVNSQLFEGPTATLFAYDDQITPIKILVKALKDYAMGKVKSGFFGTDALTENMIIQLSTLPTKDELKGKIVGVLAAPLTGMVTVLNGNLRGLVYAINQIRLQKGGE